MSATPGRTHLRYNRDNATYGVRFYMKTTTTMPHNHVGNMSVVWSSIISGMDFPVFLPFSRPNQTLDSVLAGSSQLLLDSGTW